MYAVYKELIMKQHPTYVAKQSSTKTKISLQLPGSHRAVGAWLISGHIHMHRGSATLRPNRVIYVCSN